MIFSAEFGIEMRSFKGANGKLARRRLQRLQWEIDESVNQEFCQGKEAGVIS